MYETFDFVGICIKYLYVMAFTSDWKYSGSNSGHKVEMTAEGYTYSSYLANPSGDGYQSNKGDLWKLSFERNFNIDQCITPDIIDYIAVVEGSNDGWNINSIVTFFVFDEYYSKLATVDLNVYRWIDGDGADSHKRFELTKVF